MTRDFLDLSYLSNGSAIQQNGLTVIQHSNVMEILQNQNPILAGTLPLDIFIEGSDLDILCCASDLPAVEKRWKHHFANQEGFMIHSKVINSISTLIGTFQFESFHFELFAQPVPTQQQIAYLHLIREYEILTWFGEDFKQKIIALKKRGVKTEPAFAQLLQLPGDPYEAILHYTL